MTDVLRDLRMCSLLSLFLQPILYGIYLVTCRRCAAALTRVNGRWRSRRELQWPFLLAGIFLLTNTTCSLCLQLYNNLDLFCYGSRDGSSYLDNYESHWRTLTGVRNTV